MKINRAAVERLCDRNDIAELRLFGSVARGEDTGESDIDLLAEFSRRKSLLDLVRIERAFSEEIGRKVDLLTPAAVSPHLRDRILEQSELLYERAE